MGLRSDKWKSLKSDAWYGLKIIPKLNAVDIQIIEDFISQFEAVDIDTWEIAVNRMFRGDQNKPKNWTMIMEVLTVVGKVKRSAICPHCMRLAPSDSSLPFFIKRLTREHDEYYCGCMGWE